MQNLLDISFCQTLCNTISQEIGFPCNFMGDTGVIVASSIPARIGQVHDMAGRIMAGEFDEYCVTAEEASKSPVMLEGINMALDLDSQRIASFSIAGPLHQVKPLAKVVHLAVAKLIETAHKEHVLEQTVGDRTQYLQDVAELSSDWFWEQDADLKFINFSGWSVDQLRRQPTSFVGKRRWELPIQTDPLELVQHRQACESRKPFKNFEYSIPAETGEMQHYSVSGTPVFDSTGLFTGYRGVGRNLTKLKKAEDEIKSNAKFLSQIVDGSSVPMFVIDKNGVVTHWNQACELLTGHSAMEMLYTTEVWKAFYSSPRKTMAELVLAQVSDAEMEGQYHRYSRSKLIPGAIEAEHWLPSLGLDGKWLFFTAAPIYDEHGEITGAIETLQDVSDKHTYSDLLEQQKSELELSHALLEDRVQERTAELQRQLDFLEQLIESMPGPVFYRNALAEFLGCNQEYADFIGKSKNDIIGKSMLSVLPAQVADTHHTKDQALIRQAGKYIYEDSIVDHLGKAHDMLVHKATFTNLEGQVAGLVGVLVDITERKKMEENLRQVATVFENCAEGVSITDPSGTIIAVNKAFVEITGFTENEILGQNSKIMQSGRQDRKFYLALWDSLIHTGRWQGELWNKRKNEEVYPISLSITAVHNKDGHLTNYVSTFSDITVQKHNEEKIHSLAFKDSLTKLPNRRCLMEKLQRTIRTSSLKEVYGALLFIDLDNFKSINDTLGHDTGDVLLIQVADRLLQCVRKKDTVARLGGDEFVLLLEDLGDSAEEAQNLVERVTQKILIALNKEYILAEQPYRVSPSIGIALFGDGDALSPEDLLKQADIAMYQAKKSGKNSMKLFDISMQKEAEVRVTLERELRTAIGRGQMHLLYQPQVNQNGRVQGMEALVRWNHPEKGLISPAEFIPVAEECGLIVPLGNWVLEEACRVLTILQRNPQTEQITLSVNVSAVQFRQPDFVSTVVKIVDKAKLNPHGLKLELTESLLFENTEEVINKMDLLKSKGIGFSLDDFGVGFSSLSYLKRLPLDQLKIDKSFVQHITSSNNDAIIAQSIIGLARNLGLAVIAEGVETWEQKEYLEANNCLAYQGYLFGKPMRFEELHPLLIA